MNSLAVRFSTLVFLILSATGCTHLVSTSTTSVPAARTKPVTASTEKFIFLAFNFNNDYVNDMADQLANQCPDGRITGILTKHESIVYFPLIAHKVRVTASGYCGR
jgi:hypothetical protein